MLKIPGTRFQYRGKAPRVRLPPHPERPTANQQVPPGGGVRQPGVLQAGRIKVQVVQAVLPAVPVVQHAVRVLRGVRAEVVPVQGRAVHPAVPAVHHRAVPQAGEEDR